MGKDGDARFSFYDLRFDIGTVMSLTAAMPRNTRCDSHPPTLETFAVNDPVAKFHITPTQVMQPTTGSLRCVQMPIANMMVVTRVIDYAMQ